MEIKQGDIVKPVGARWEDHERAGRFVVAEMRGDRALITYIGKRGADGFHPCGMSLPPQETVRVTDIEPAEPGTTD